MVNLYVVNGIRENRCTVDNKRRVISSRTILKSMAVEKDGVLTTSPATR